MASKEESNDEADRPLAQCIAPESDGTTIRSTVCESPLATVSLPPLLPLPLLSLG